VRYGSRGGIGRGEEGRGHEIIIRQSLWIEKKRGELKRKNAYRRELLEERKGNEGELNSSKEALKGCTQLLLQQKNLGEATGRKAWVGEGGGGLGTDLATLQTIGWGSTSRTSGARHTRKRQKGIPPLKPEKARKERDQ